MDLGNKKNKEKKEQAIKKHEMAIKVSEGQYKIVPGLR